MKINKGEEFRLYGNGPWCKVTEVKDSSISFKMLGTLPITGSIPVHSLEEHLKPIKEKK